MRAFAVSVRVAIALAAGATVAVTPARAAAPTSTEGANGPTIVLVHGAWEQGSSWRLVAEQLRDRGYRVVVPEIALRTLAGDAAQIADVVKGIDGPAVLVGHSYGGAVISNVAASPNVAALVFIAAFAPDRGESILGLDARDLGSLVAASLVPVPFVVPAIGVDLFINRLLYRSVFAADVAEPAATEMAATQRPLTLAALSEPSAEPSWKTIASWYLVAANDLAIPPATERFMAGRAKATTVEVASSHAAPVSHPDAVVDTILSAARHAAPPPEPEPPPSLPSIAKLRVAPSAFRAARSGPTVRPASAGAATRVSYDLDLPATVRFTVQRSARGRSVGGRCVVPTARNRARRACSRFAAVRGSFARKRPAGADRFTFTARIVRRTLAPGRYRLVATPTAAGLAGTPARAAFRIVG